MGTYDIDGFKVRVFNEAIQKHSVIVRIKLHRHIQEKHLPETLQQVEE